MERFISAKSIHVPKWEDSATSIQYKELRV